MPTGALPARLHSGMIRDESDRDGMRVVVELRRDAYPQVVLNNLYKLTHAADPVLAGDVGVLVGVELEDFDLAFEFLGDLVNKDH